MYDKELHSFCSEFYIVEKSIEVVVNRNGEETSVRIEALRDDETMQYCTRVYKREHVTFQPTYPQTNDRHQTQPQDCVVWIAWIDFPWIQRESADAALFQALGFLRERSDSPK